MKRVLLINPNTSRDTTAMMHRILQDSLSSVIDVTSETAARGDPMITTEEGLATSVQEVLRIGRARAHEFSAIVVSAFGDPGVEDLRAELVIPIIGIGEASLREAAADGRRFGVATTTPGLEASISCTVARLGLNGLCTGTRIPLVDPVAIAISPKLQIEKLAEGVRACIDDGARAVVIGGGPLSEAAVELSAQFEIPIISAVAAAGRHARRVLAAKFG